MIYSKRSDGEYEKTRLFVKKINNKQGVNLYLQAAAPDFQPILAKIKELEKLNQAFLHYLPPQLQTQCQVSNLTERLLVLIVDNAAIATQIRFQAPQLVQKLKQHAWFQKVQDIQCKVRPPNLSPRLQTNTKSSSNMAPLSQTTAKMIYETAQSLTDEKLKEIMERIAQHTK